MNILVVGLGSIARKHINALQEMNLGLTVYALRSSKLVEEIPEIINIFDLSVLKNLKIDFAIISNPTGCHLSALTQLIDFEFPLFIEKPLFDTLEVGNILDEIKRNNIITYVACNLRFLGCISFVREFITDRRINEVNSYCGSYLPDWRPGKEFREIYSANREMGGGVHMDLIHEIDYLYWLFGMPVSVRSTKTSKSALNITSVDYANYLFSYPSFSVNVILNYFRRDPKRNLEIVTEDGTIVVDLLKNEVSYNSEVIFKSSKSIKNTYKDQLQFFLDEVIAKNVKFNTATEAFEILKICIAND